MCIYAVCLRLPAGSELLFFNFVVALLQRNLLPVLKVRLEFTLYQLSLVCTLHTGGWTQEGKFSVRHPCNTQFTSVLLLLNTVNGK